MKIVPMTPDYAKIISTWTYEGEYSIYSFEPNEEVIAELLCGEYIACLNAEEELLGYFCFGVPAQIPTVESGVYEDRMLDFGVGLSPDRCGKGFGEEFVKAGIEYVSQHFGNQDIRLSVADFNKRAIKVYERNGFVRQKTVTHKYSKAPFWIMVRAK